MQPHLPNIDNVARPFIRWAGGKSWLVSKLRKELPIRIENYFEPFLGGGSIFFSLAERIEVAHLSDINNELINAYKQIKVSPLRVAERLQMFERTESFYYKLRSQRDSDKVWQAARFIYLNKMSYNGIYRVNRKGEFNVPYGHNDLAPIFDEANLLAASKCLKKAKIHCRDFGAIVERVGKNDLVFLDPPYTVAHSNNGFIEYNQKLFTWQDQHRLAELIKGIKKKKAKFVLTNAFHESVETLFGSLGNLHEVPRASTVTSVVEKRDIITEYIVTNCY